MPHHITSTTGPQWCTVMSPCAKLHSSAPPCALGTSAGQAPHPTTPPDRLDTYLITGQLDVSRHQRITHHHPMFTSSPATMPTQHQHGPHSYSPPPTNVSAPTCRHHHSLTLTTHTNLPRTSHLNTHTNIHHHHSLRGAGDDLGTRVVLLCPITV